MTKERIESRGAPRGGAATSRRFVQDENATNGDQIATNALPQHTPLT